MSQTRDAFAFRVALALYFSICFSSLFAQEYEIKVAANYGTVGMRFFDKDSFICRDGYNNVVIYALINDQFVRQTTLNNLVFPHPILITEKLGYFYSNEKMYTYDKANWNLIKTEDVSLNNTDYLISCKFTSQGTFFAYNQKTRRLEEWSFSTAKKVSDFPIEITEDDQVAFNATGAYVAVMNNNNHVAVLETSTGKTRFSFEVKNRHSPKIALTSDGEAVIVASIDIQTTKGRIEIYRNKSKQPSLVYNFPTSIWGVVSVVPSDDCSVLAIECAEEDKNNEDASTYPLLFFDVKTRAIYAKIEKKTGIDHLVWSSDLTKVAIRYEDHRLVIHTISKGKAK